MTNSLSPITASIVVFNNKLEEIQPLIQRLQSDHCVRSWVVVDNGISDEIRDAVQTLGGEYIRTGENIGFGSAHNIALKHFASVDAPYHLVLNPDIEFGPDALGRLAAMMDSAPEVGLTMPKVVYPEGSTQYLCKLLPSPIDLILRRFAPRSIQRMAKKRIATFDLRSFDYASPACIPYLSGCFMFLRRSVLENVGGFDENFFLYMEDLDLCRRIGERSKLLYWPEVSVTHIHQKASYKSFRILRLHLMAAVHYFNKWGWFFDPTRNKINQTTLEQLRAKGYDV